MISSRRAGRPGAARAVPRSSAPGAGPAAALTAPRLLLPVLAVRPVGVGLAEGARQPQTGHNQEESYDQVTEIQVFSPCEAMTDTPMAITTPAMSRTMPI